MKRQYMRHRVVVLHEHISTAKRVFRENTRHGAVPATGRGFSVRETLFRHFRGKRRFTSFDQPDSRSGSGRRQTGPARSSRQRT